MLSAIFKWLLMKLQQMLCPQQWPKSVFMCCLIGHTRLKFFSVWRLPLTQIQIPVKKGKSSSKKYVTRPGESMLKWGLPSLLEDEGQHIQRCILFLRIALKGTLRNDRSQVNLTMYNKKKIQSYFNSPKGALCSFVYRLGWGWFSVYVPVEKDSKY